jgi:lipopolysaccharide transport system ATP-binding protein
MEKEVLIRAEGVSKKFCRNLKKSLIYGGGDIVKGFFGIEKKQELRPDEFWAVSDVNFEVRRGECLGLIGHNGAGKSTLLKMLNGLISPDKGRIEMHGKVGALIELGAGFSPLLTGRENIYNNGAILGFTKEQIDGKLEEIIEFSEIADFIDSPVQNYSSGMKVRLGFAIAAQMEPDILIIDEVLAVGDLGFQAKCFNRINELINKCAIIFVSHSMPQVARIASEVIHLHKGSILFQGKNVGDGIETYYKGFNSEVAQFVGKENSVKINDFKLFSDETPVSENENIRQFSDIKLQIKYNVNQDLQIKNHDLIINIYDQSLRSIMALISTDNLKENIANAQNPINIEIIFKCILAPGKYSIWLHFAGSQNDESKNHFSYAAYQSYFNFNVVGGSVFSSTPIHMPALWKSF